MAKVEPLTVVETRTISTIPSAAKAAAIWARFEERKRQAKEDRIALGKELIAVRAQLATKGCKGLFTRWLQTQHIPHERAYIYIALAGGGKTKTQFKCYATRLSFLKFQSKFNKSTPAERKKLLREFVAWLKKEYKIA